MRRGSVRARGKEKEISLLSTPQHLPPNATTLPPFLRNLLKSVDKIKADLIRNHAVMLIFRMPGYKLADPLRIRP
ncbi:hypothetical protein I7I48_04402 [Histoplasma ohiense]|nr:hypothetical protein I7I48_04402 [Histoplasma ohiense (nom. inval.)]